MISDDENVQITKSKAAETKNSALLISKSAIRHDPFTHTHTHTHKHIFKANSLTST
jgi:hypothetical protein